MKTIRIGDLELRFIVDETQGSGDLVVFEFVVPARARVPVPHYHRDVDEMVYGVAGTLTTTIDGEEHELMAGDSAFIAHGRVHHHENQHDETARALIVMNKGSIGIRYFEEMAQAVGGPENPDPAKIKDIMLRYGLVPA
jgi:quercetin dioxygenase-like cupin family protein